MIWDLAVETVGESQSQSTPEFSHGAPRDGAPNKIYDKCRSPMAFHIENLFSAEVAS
jgi:hypothetical protein